MSLDRILATAGSSRSDLDSQVSQYRTMSRGYEMILADHFDVEDLSTVIETLAVRLARIEELAAPMLVDPSPAGDLARSITAVVDEDPEAALALVDSRFNPNLTGVLSKGTERLFGHPEMVLVTHSAVDLQALSHTHIRHLVHTPSGQVLKVPEMVSTPDAAEAFEKHLAGA